MHEEDIASQQWLMSDNTGLRKRNEELRRLNGELERLASTLAHDLKEPLRTVRNLAELLLRREVENSDELLSTIIRSADRMIALTQNILALADGHQEPVRKQVDSQAVAECAVELLRDAVEKSGAIVKIHSLPVVQADEGQLLRLFLNLVSNAIKYCRERKPEIHIAARSEPEGTIFSVTDNGIGIDPRDHDRIFDPFRRLETASNTEGSGIGLAICKRIVECHDGRIWVESRPGQGSTFYFRIPSEVAVQNPRPLEPQLMKIPHSAASSTGAPHV